VPAYNEEKNIVRKLENLLQQGYTFMEVIVVNDGSTDRTAEIVQSFIEKNSLQHKVKLLNISKREGKPSAINHGFRYCKGEIVVISDADTILGDNALQRIVQRFQDGKVGGVTGKLSMINYGESFSTYLEENYRNVFDILRLGESCMDSTPIFNGALMALRRQLFSPLRSDTIADDTEIALRVREKGYKAVFDYTATVYAFTPEHFIWRIKQKVRRAEGIIQSFIRHKDILFRSVYGKYGLIIFPCEFFMFLVSPFLFLLIIFLFPFVLQLSALSTMQILFILGVGLVFLGSTSFILKYLLKRSLINPVKFIGTFLEHQIFLILALFSLLFRKGSVKWERTD
jgi:cellulose synthase/poly-beta-1,6-N-acetylglucosamine synthase-like glycosyltransferase